MRPVVLILCCYSAFSLCANSAWAFPMRRSFNPDRSASIFGMTGSFRNNSRAYGADFRSMNRNYFRSPRLYGNQNSLRRNYFGAGAVNFPMQFLNYITEDARSAIGFGAYRAGSAGFKRF